MNYDFKKEDIEIYQTEYDCIDSIRIKSLDITIRNIEQFYEYLKKLFQLDMITITCVKCRKNFQLSKDGYNYYVTINDSRVECPYCHYREELE